LSENGERYRRGGVSFALADEKVKAAIEGKEVVKGAGGQGPAGEYRGEVKRAREVVFPKWQYLG